MENQEILVKPISSLKWYQKITVEPSMFLYMIAFMLTSVVEQAFYLNKACLVNHQYPEEICSTLELHDEIKKEVQITTATFHQWNNIAGHVVPIILALFMGSWSDRRGRKLPLIMGLTGKFIFSVMIMINATQDSWPLEYVIFTATIPGALLGADVAIFASSFAYIADVSTQSERTIRITILDVCYLSTMPIGVALGSVLYNHVVDKSFIIMFAINVGCLILALLYTFTRLKWQTTASQRPMSEVGWTGALSDFFDKEHLKQSYRTMTKKRDMHRRSFLWIFMFAMLFYTFQRDEKPLTYLYTQLKFRWTVETYSNFKTFTTSGYLIMMLFGIPLMSSVLGFRDTVIAMIGTTAHIIARFVYATAEVPYVFYIGGAIASLGPVVGPILRSMTSKVVPVTERGKVFALLSVCDNAVPFISGVLYAQVYNATIGITPGIFWLTIASQVIVFVLMLSVHITLRGRQLAVPEEEKKEILEKTDNDNEIDKEKT